LRLSYVPRKCAIVANLIGGSNMSTEMNRVRIVIAAAALALAVPVAQAQAVNPCAAKK